MALLKMSVSTAKRALVGATWLTAGGYLSFALNLAGNIILARLLFPRDFGTFALVGSAADLLMLIAGLSFSQGIIQMSSEPDIEDTAYLLTVWLIVILLIVGILTAGVVWVLRGPSIAILLLVVVGARQITILSYVYSAQLERAFRYRGLSGLRVASAIVSVTVGLLLASVGAGVWSLVGREAATILITYGGLRLLLRWRYGRRYNPQTARRLMGFSLRMLASRSLELINARADIFLLGLGAGTVTLGFYDRARFLAELGYYAVSFAAVQVAFPLYARFQADLPRLEAAYRLVHYFLVRVMIPVMVAMIVLPRDLVAMLYGQRWDQAVGPLRWLAGYAFFLPILENTRVLLIGIGRLDDVVRVRMIQVLTIVLALVVFVPRWGAVGAGMAATLSAMTGIAMAYSALARRIPGPALVLTYLRPAIAGAGAGLIVPLISQGLRAGVSITVARPAILLALPIAYAVFLAALERGELVHNARLLWPGGRLNEGPAV